MTQTQATAQENKEVEKQAGAVQENAAAKAQEKEQRHQGAKHEGKDPNTVYIGKKGVMEYVLAVVTQFNNASIPAVTIKARGNMISRAVDVAEIVRHRFVTGASVKDIRISTEELLSEDGRMSKVSSIEIVLSK